MIVFDEHWFELNHTKLLKIYNIGFFCRCLIGERFKDIIKITPNMIVVNNGNSQQAYIFIDDFIAKMLYKKLKFFWKLIHLWDMKISNRFLTKYNLGFDTLTVYSEGDPETNSFDAYMIEKDDTYVNANSNTTAEIVSDSGTLILLRNCDYTTSPRYFISRGLILFDTSSLGSCIINSASIHLYAMSSSNFNEDDTGQAETVIVSANTSNDSSVSTGDYDDMGSTAFASKTFGNILTDSYNEFSLDSAGIAQINKYGTSKFGLRLKGDIDVSQPSGTNETKFYSADYSSSTRAPKLVIDFTPQVSNSIISMMV